MSASAKSARLPHVFRLARGSPRIAVRLGATGQICPAGSDGQPLASGELHVNRHLAERFVAPARSASLRRNVTNRVHVADVSSDPLEYLFDLSSVLRFERDATG